MKNNLPFSEEDAEWAMNHVSQKSSELGNSFRPSDFFGMFDWDSLEGGKRDAVLHFSGVMLSHLFENAQEIALN